MVSIKKNDYNVKITFYKERSSKDYITSDDNDRDLLAESLARSKRLVLDYAYNNTWDYFITLTFDVDKLDRFNITLCKDKLLKAFSNYKNHYDKDLKYILIPEFHKDKKAIHFHGLLKTKKNHFFTTLFYNYDYHCVVLRHEYFFKRFGANQLVPIHHQQEQVGNYICKYMTKGALRIFDVSYFASKGLNVSTNLLNSDSKDLKQFLLCEVLDGKRPSFYNTFVTQYTLPIADFEKYYKEDK